MLQFLDLSDQFELTFVCFLNLFVDDNLLVVTQGCIVAVFSFFCSKAELELEILLYLFLLLNIGLVQLQLELLHSILQVLDESLILLERLGMAILHVPELPLVLLLELILGLLEEVDLSLELSVPLLCFLMLLKQAHMKLELLVQVFSQFDFYL